ncbi:unnamed protein product [Closterium sp. NIES-64]|nr:unnamed protein product [Closterium sp. NIES-64]
MQGDFPCKNPTTLKGKEPSWNNLVSLCDLDDAQLTAGADASETADDVSASRLSGYGSGQCEADSSTEEGDANNEDGANGHFGLELGTGLFAMERTEVEGTKKEGIETEGMEEKVSEETCLDGAGKEEQNEGLLTRKDEKNNRDKVADSFIASALLDHEPLALQPSSNPPVFFNYARTTTPASTSLVSASPSACAERTPVAAAACATSASVFLPTPMEPTVPSWHVVTGLPALVLPPPGGYASTSSDDCNCGCSTGYDTGYHTVLNDDCKGDCKGECNSRGSSCLYESTVPPGLPSTPPRHDTMMFPVFPPCGTNSEEQRQFKATAARGTIIGAAQNVFTVKKEEKVDLDADMDADVGADVAADVDASSRATRGYGYSKPGSGGAVPRTAAAMQKSRRRAANRASAKRIRIRQQQHLQKLECETREPIAPCMSLSGAILTLFLSPPLSLAPSFSRPLSLWPPLSLAPSLSGPLFLSPPLSLALVPNVTMITPDATMKAEVAEASRQVAAQMKQNEALVEEKQRLPLLLGER